MAATVLGPLLALPQTQGLTAQGPRGELVVVPKPCFFRTTRVLGGFSRGSTLICAVLCL